MDDTLMTDNTYKMTISLKVLDHLGINLYSNVAAVLTEAVANAWDADAEEIRIRFNIDDDTITISDDGHGMSIEDMNTKYLHVGYQRRVDGPNGDKSLSKERYVMGRKGLGKLSLFSIADTIEIQSHKEGNSHGLTMHTPTIRATIEEKEQDYYPAPLPEDKISVAKGTIIRLTDLKKGRLGITASALPQRLARRFSVLASEDFRIYVNDKEITPSDRGDIKTAEFLWNLGDESSYHEGFSQIKENKSLPGKLDAWESDRVIRGWIGTASKPKDLETDAGNMNSIVVMARGRLFQENILDKINDGRFYTHYLTGQIEADFLDDGPEDIATSDRQRVIEDDERYQSVLVYLKTMLNKIEPQWNKWRETYKADEIADEHPAVATWFAGLPDGWRDQAKKVIATTTKFDTDNDDDKKTLIRNTILAFERLRLKGCAEALIEAMDSGPEAVLDLFIGLDDMEAFLYYDIIKARLDVIKAFYNLVDKNQKEKVLQLYLFDHLWLLDPTWERATGSELMETRLTEEGLIVTNFTEKEKLGRLDIKYKTYAGKHLIIELKRAGIKLKSEEMYAQGSLYVKKLKKVLAAKGESDPDIEVIFVIGKPLDDEINDPDSIKHLLNAISPGSSIVHYDSLIEGAIASYSEYIQQNTEVEKYAAIVDNL